MRIEIKKIWKIFLTDCVEIKVCEDIIYTPVLRTKTPSEDNKNTKNVHDEFSINKKLLFYRPFFVKIS